MSLQLWLYYFDFAGGWLVRVTLVAFTSHALRLAQGDLKSERGRLICGFPESLVVALAVCKHFNHRPVIMILTDLRALAIMLLVRDGAFFFGARLRSIRSVLAVDFKILYAGLCYT